MGVKYNWDMLGTKILEERESKFNGNLRVVRTLGLGTYIQANGLTQSGGIVEKFWDQTLKKIKKEKLKNVLVLGLGGGTVVKLLKKYWPGVKITGVDIDPVMVELGQKYLGLTGVKIIIGDAYNLPGGDFDLVLVDLYNGDKFPKKFKGKTFLGKFKNYPLVIFNRLYYGENKLVAKEFGQKLKKYFESVEVYNPEVNIMFICRN